MAITGEIDLTQGLDFFRHKELPSIIPRVLPWVRDKVNSGKDESSISDSSTYSISFSTGNNSISTINTTSNSRITFSNRYITTMRVNYTLNLRNTISENSNELSWRNIHNDDIIDTIVYYSNADSYISSNNIYCELTDDYISDSDYDSYISESKSKRISDNKFHLGDIREEKDNSPATRKCGCCGKRILGRNTKCKKCIVKEKLYWYPFHKRYPWDEKPEKDTEFDYIPWSQKCTLKRSKSRGSKLREIPWLSNLESRIFGYYEEELRSTEEVDNSSYLTNMRWLGISEQSGRPRYTAQQEAIEFNTISDSDIVVDDTALFVSA